MTLAASALAAALYPTNLDGTPEFGSILLTLDHLTNRADHHVVQKFVLSTELQDETLLALFRYYKEEHLLTRASTIKLLQEAAKTDYPIYVYTTPQNIQILASTAAWDTLVQSPDGGQGSALLAVDFITSHIARIHGELAERNGGEFVPLILLSLGFLACEPAPATPAPVDPEPGLADALVRGADFQDVTEQTI